MFPASSLSRRAILRGAGIVGAVSAFGVLTPTAAHAGEISQQIQKSLWGLYYYDGYVDGWQGSMTTTAIKSFQKDRGLTVDGHAGSVTSGELGRVVRSVQSAVGVVTDRDYGSLTRRAVQGVQRSRGLVVDGRAGTRTMQALGVRRVLSGTGTVALQKSLKSLYYYSGVIDGSIGSMTTTAIRAFQGDRMLETDGYAGPVTRDELDDVVKAVQSRVGVRADGDYGGLTQGAVKTFQRSEGLVMDGWAGARTMQALGVQRILSGEESGGFALQKSLWGLLYYDGAIDGNLNSATSQAVKGFQKDRGLVVDGYAGPITRSELDDVVRAVQSRVGVLADGDYGSLTQAAVKDFQTSEGLVVDGRAGAETMSALGVDRIARSHDDPDYSGELVVIDQMHTGPFSAQNCGPTSAVIALHALGRAPAGTHKTQVINMRSACHIPSGTYGSDVSHLITGLTSSAYDTPARRVTYAEALDAAKTGAPVILNVNHGVLLGGEPTYGHYVVAMGTNSAGDFYVSDPGRAKSIGIKAYTRTQLEKAARKNRGIIVG